MSRLTAELLLDCTMTMTTDDVFRVVFAC